MSKIWYKIKKLYGCKNEINVRQMYKIWANFDDVSTFSYLFLGLHKSFITPKPTMERYIVSTSLKMYIQAVDKYFTFIFMCLVSEWINV